jgi:hypothetical protein
MDRLSATFVSPRLPTVEKSIARVVVFGQGKVANFLPALRSDEEAGDWLQSAYLSEYGLSGMKKGALRTGAQRRVDQPAPARRAARYPEGGCGESQHADPAAHPHDDRSTTRRNRRRAGEKPARLCGQGTARLDTGVPKGLSPEKRRDTEKSGRLPNLM